MINRNRRKHDNPFYKAILILTFISIGATVTSNYLYIDSLKQITEDASKERTELLNRIAYLEDLTQPKLFTVTGYTASRDECDATPNQTATMSKPVVGLTVAVSQDYIHLLGKRVYIEGIGIREVNDLMNARYTQSIDVLAPTKKYARDVVGKSKRLVCVLN